MKALKQWYHNDAVRLGSSTNVSKAQSHAINAGIKYHRRMYGLLELHCKMALPDWKLLVEPWFHTAGKADLCSPDGVLLHRHEPKAIVIEVKKNWKDGRDQKLLNLYLPVAKSAFKLETSKPLMIVGNVRGLPHKPFCSLAELLTPLAWQPGDPTPTLLKL